MKRVFCVMQGERYEGGSIHGVYTSLDKALEFVQNNFSEYDLSKNVATFSWERKWHDGCDWLSITRWDVE